MKSSLRFILFLLALFAIPASHAQNVSRVYIAGEAIAVGQFVTEDSQNQVHPVAANSTSGVIGMALTGAGQATNPITILVVGWASANVDGACSVGQVVVISTSLKGQGHCQNSFPAGQVLGMSEQNTASSAGFANILVSPMASSAQAGSGGSGSSIFTSFQWGSNTAITGSANYVQITATPSAIVSLTQSGVGSSGSPFVDVLAIAVQGSDTHLLSSGTVNSSVGALFCTDANLGATNVGCTAGGTPGGSTGQLQYNNSGGFGGTSSFVFSGTSIQMQSGGVLDLSAGTPASALKLPSSAGAAPNTDSFIAYDTTGHHLVYGQNGGTTVTVLGGSVTNPNGNFALCGNLIAVNATVGAGSSGSSCDSSTEGQSNWGLNVTAALTQFSNTKVTVDARGDANTAVTTNPWVNLTGDASIVALLPNHSLTTSVQWAIDATDAHLIGAGNGGASSLFLGGSFPTGTAALLLGDVTLQRNSIIVENWRVDTTGCATCWAITEQNVQEGAGIYNLFVKASNNAGTTNAAVEFDTSGHYMVQNLEVLQSGDNPCFYFHSKGYAGGLLSRITCNNTGNVTGTDAVKIDSTDGNFTFNFGQAIHTEGFGNGLHVLANAGGAFNFLDCTGTCTDLVHLDSGALPTAIEYATCSACTNVINDLSLTPNVVLSRSQFANGIPFYTNGYAFFASIGGHVTSQSSSHTLNLTESGVNVTGTTTITINPALAPGTRWIVFEDDATHTGTLSASSGVIHANGASASTLSIASLTGVEVECDGTNCQAIGLGGGSGGAPAFNTITGGTNTTAAMIVGTGGSLAVSGTGTIAATSSLAVGGITVTGTPTAGQALVATSGTAADWQTLGAGVVTRAVGGTTSTDTILAGDCTPAPGRVLYNGSVAVAVTLPTATTLGCTNAVFRITNNTTGSATAVTVTPTTWTVRGGATIVIAQGQYATFYVDPAGTSWDVDNSDEPFIAGSGVTFVRGQYGLTISASGSGSSALSSVTASVTNSSISNGNNNETLQYLLTSTTDGFDVAESAASSGTGVLFSSGTLATSTAFATRFFVTGSATSTFGNQVALDVDNITAATSGQNQASATQQVCGNIWNGSVATKDCKTETITYAAGTNPASTITTAHSGSTGQVTYIWSGTPIFNFNSLRVTAGTVSGTSVSVAQTFQSGLDVAGAGTGEGAATFRGGDIIGGSTATAAATATFRGGNVTTNTNSSSTGGNAILQGGACTSVTTASLCNGQARVNSAAFTTGTAAANDLACVTAANTIASCSGTGTGQYVGVIDSAATNDVIVTAIGGGGTHTFNATSATFTNGHWVCQSTATANLVVDSATICTAGFGIGIYVGATGTQTAPLVYMRPF